MRINLSTCRKGAPTRAFLFGAHINYQTQSSIMRCAKWQKHVLYYMGEGLFKTLRFSYNADNTKRCICKFLIISLWFSLSRSYRTMRPQIVLFGDSITEQSFRSGGWGADLADTYARKVFLQFLAPFSNWENYIQGR